MWIFNKSHWHIFSCKKHVVLKHEVYVHYQMPWMNQSPLFLSLPPSRSLSLSPSVPDSGISPHTRSREILVMHKAIKRCIHLCAIRTNPEVKRRCLNFAPSRQTHWSWLRRQTAEHIGRNTWVRRYGKCISTSVNVCWTLKFRPAGFGLRKRVCGLDFMVVVLGKPILKHCLRPASSETDGIFNSAISVLFIGKPFKDRLHFSPDPPFFPPLTTFCCLLSLTYLNLWSIKTKCMSNLWVILCVWVSIPICLCRCV